MSFLLDTNIVSYHLKRPRGLMHRFVQHSGHLYVSSVALAELYVWAFGQGQRISISLNSQYFGEELIVETAPNHLAS